MNSGSIRTSRIVGLALGVGVFFTAQVTLVALAAGRPIDFQRDVVQELLFWFVWAFLTPLVLTALRRYPLDSKPWWRPLAAHAAVCALLAPVQLFVAFGARPAIGWVAGAISGHDVLVSLTRSRPSIVWGLFMGVFFYAVIVGTYTVLRYRELYAAEQTAAAELARRGAALEAELAGAKLDALRSQLHPHFLFNTLNAISVLSQDDAHRTRQMLLRLASLLRRSLDEQAHEVALRQELSFLDDYIDIMRARFGERLDIRLAVAPDALDARVPVFLLQPLMENAIEHGERDDGRTVIALSAGRRDGTLHVVVENSGPSLAAGAVVREGVGLGNTRARLRELYGDRARLCLGAAREPATAPGARVELAFPYAPMAASE